MLVRVFWLFVLFVVVEQKNNFEWVEKLEKSEKKENNNNSNSNNRYFSCYCSSCEESECSTNSACILKAFPSRDLSHLYVDRKCAQNLTDKFILKLICNDALVFENNQEKNGYNKYNDFNYIKETHELNHYMRQGTEANLPSSLVYTFCCHSEQCNSPENYNTKQISELKLLRPYVELRTKMEQESHTLREVVVVSGIIAAVLILILTLFVFVLTPLANSLYYDESSDQFRYSRIYAFRARLLRLFGLQRMMKKENASNGVIVNGNLVELNEKFYSVANEVNNNNKAVSFRSRRKNTNLTAANNENSDLEFDGKALEDTSSGAGTPNLRESSISKQINLSSCIGVGRFGKVFLGEWNGKKVAVKIFSDINSRTASHEAAIYSNYNLRDENLLFFIAIDEYTDSFSLETWLVFEYHEHGSLFDFLTDLKIKHSECNTLEQTFNMLFKKSELQFYRDVMLNTIDGMSYLHQCILGQGGTKKPSVAHRDFKAKNILVKLDGSCCIADFGLAITEEMFDCNNNSKLLLNRASSLNNTHASENNSEDKLSRIIKLDRKIVSTYRTGTNRYMAPELFDPNFSNTDFGIFLQADVYSYGLFMWEVLNFFVGANREYSLVLSNCIPSNPTDEDMFLHLFINRSKPDNINMVSNDEVSSYCLSTGQIDSLCEVMNMCYNYNVKSRPSMEYVKKRLHTILE